MSKKAAPDPRAVTDALWYEGDLSYLLLRQQLAAAEAWRLSWDASRKFYLECSRRFGKSFLFCVEAVTAAIIRPNSIVRYAAPTAKMVGTIVAPHMRDILEHCPAQMMPRFVRQEGLWRFPNGSEIHVSGCDNGGADRLRGAYADLCIVDEAAMIDDVGYVVSDVLMPQTLTRDGRVLLGSTPGHSPEHDAFRLAEDCRQRGAYMHATIHDCEHITAAQIEEYQKEARGLTSTTWRREYLAEWVVDSERAVVPEWVTVSDLAVQEVERPEFFRSLVAADIGFNDLTVGLFGYWHFDRAVAVVEDEFVCEGKTSGDIDEECAKMERRRGAVAKIRVADAPPIVIAEMCKARHQAGRPGGWAAGAKSSAQKGSDDALLAAMRRDIAVRFDMRGNRIPGKLLVHPRCRTLIAHLGSAIWNHARTSFDRSGTMGHFDAVDALTYFMRHVDRNTNPYPAQRVSQAQWRSPRAAGSITHNALSEAYRPGWRPT